MRGPAGSDRSVPALLIVAIGAFALVAYAPGLKLPFIGDDYVFLDKTRDVPFFQVWSYKNIDFDWYRPWSRELHFWALQKLLGANELGFRTFGVALYVVALGLYFALLRSFASPLQASLATLGVASLALWATPLLWISGSQDLWMLVFALTSMLLFVRRHPRWALVPFVFALLSKETAAVLPGILVTFTLYVERRPIGATLRRVWPFMLLTATWLLIHPTLGSRLLSKPHTLEAEIRPPLVEILWKTLLANINLDSPPSPSEGDWGALIRIPASAVILSGAALLAIHAPYNRESDTAKAAPNSSLIRFATAWAVVGWLPLLQPSISWHAYYGCVGTLGAWLGFSIWLGRHPKIAIAVIASLAILRGARASTPSWDWGNEWYQRRAGNVLSAIRSDLRRQHPTFPTHSRVFLARVPNNIGLVAGKSPALRVWYADSTLEAGFYSYYQVRAASTPPGNDYFFRFDSLAGMIEIYAGPEDIERGRTANPEWEDDHEKLAMLFLRSGDHARAAVEFEKLSLLPSRPDAAGYAAVSWEAAGDTVRAESLLAATRLRAGIPPADLENWIRLLRSSYPGRGGAR